MTTRTYVGISLVLLLAGIARADLMTRKPEIMALDHGGKTSATLGTILTKLGTNPGTLIISGGDWQITSNIVFPSTMTTMIVPGSRLDIAGGITVGVNCELLAGDYEIFTGGGSATGTVKCLYRFTSWGSRSTFAIGDGSHAVTIEQYPNADTNSTDDITSIVDGGTSGASGSVSTTNGICTITFPGTNGAVNATNPVIAIGMIVPFAAGSAPGAYWLECNGASLSTNTYSNLFAVISYNYGGSGATFKVPDLRGMFLRGWNHGRTDGWADPNRSTRISPVTGATVGDAVGSIQPDTYQSHTHSFNMRLLTGSSTVPNQGISTGATTAGYTTASGGSETRPNNMALPFYIRAN